jgi:SAM-dependent methyltransferase
MSDDPDPVSTTRDTYDTVAEAYRRQWADRSLMDAHLDRFARLVRARGDGRRVLDVGCGPGFDTAALRERGLDALGIDLSWGMLRAGAGHYAAPLLQGDMRRLPFGSCFAGLWVNASLLHLPRREVPGALAEFGRVLEPAGLLFLSLKTGTGTEWLPLATGGLGGKRFFTYWSRDELAAVLQKSGFTLLEETLAQNGPTTWLSVIARSAADE